jgi:hypothetical protein
MFSITHEEPQREAGEVARVLLTSPGGQRITVTYDMYGGVDIFTRRTIHGNREQAVHVAFSDRHAWNDIRVYDLIDGEPRG